MSQTILFVDDEPWFCAPAIDALMDKGYNVISLTDGTSTIEYLESNKPADLIILDIMMPTGDKLIDPAHGRRTGVKVGEHIRQILDLRIPIIYLTVIEDQSVHNHLSRIETDAGINPCILGKPIPIGELINSVEECLISSQ